MRKQFSGLHLTPVGLLNMYNIVAVIDATVHRVLAVI